MNELALGRAVSFDHIAVPLWVFGRGKDANKAHMRKLSEAFKKLPAICRKLSPVKEIVYNFSDVNQTFVIKKNNVESDSVSLTPYTSGIFEDTMIPRIKANFFDLKTACFYIDWDDDINSWRFIITADKDQLTYNIERMKELVSAFEV